MSFLCCAIFAGLIVAIVLIHKEVDMFKNLFMCMDYATFTKWQLLGIISGVALGWCLCDVWEDHYREARDAGAVA